MVYIFVVFGYLDFNYFIVNVIIFDELVIVLFDVEICCLDWFYLDGKFNIVVEQESLLQVDVIVWQFFFSWYGLFGLMKQWLDEVFVYGFVYGLMVKLGGKKLIFFFIMGVLQVFYIVDGFFGYVIEEYFFFFEIMVRLCNFELLVLVYICGISYVDWDVYKIVQ